MQNAPSESGYVAESLRDEDCFSKSKSAFVITHIFSKRNDAKFYTELLYEEQRTACNLLPVPVLERLDDRLKKSF